MDPLREAQPEREMLALERALLRRGMHERTAKRTGCARCRRTPLIGERVFQAGDDIVLCELCAARHEDAQIRSVPVHGPEFGHTLRVLDHRAA